jgi:uncharacterized damage-inducible protein DinB
MIGSLIKYAKMKKLLLSLLLFTGLTSYSQTSAVSVTQITSAKSAFGSEMSEIMQHMKAYTLAIANQMPEDKYDFRPTKDDTVRSFGEQLKHLIFNNNHQADNILKAKTFDGPTLIRDMEVYEEIKMTKAEIVDKLSKSFDKLIARLEAMNDSDFETQFAPPFVKTPKSLRVMTMFIRDHITHHRAEIIVYLRMNGIEPAFYRPF